MYAKWALFGEKQEKRKQKKYSAIQLLMEIDIIQLYGLLYYCKECMFDFLELL